MSDEGTDAGSGRAGKSYNHELLIGASFGIFSALIAAGWLVITRMGHTHALNGYDLVALRYGVAAVLILPYAYSRFSRLFSYGWPALILLIVGGGFPYGLAAVWGLHFAPVTHGGALIAGTIPTFTALFAVAFLAQRLSQKQLFGLVLTIVGAFAIGGYGLFSEFGTQTLGHVLFLLAAMIWGLYTVTLRKYGVPPLDATAIVCIGSALLFVPTYPFILGSQIAAAPWSEILFQAFYQGVLAGIVFFLAFNRAVELIGSARGAVCLAMVPVLAALMAGPVLGEYPNGLEIFGIIAATIGVYLVTGARFRTS